MDIYNQVKSNISPLVASTMSAGSADQIVSSFLQQKQQNASYGSDGNFPDANHQSLFNSLKDQVLEKFGMDESKLTDSQKQQLNQAITDGMHEYFSR